MAVWASGPDAATAWPTTTTLPPPPAWPSVHSKSPPPAVHGSSADHQDQTCTFGAPVPDGRGGCKAFGAPESLTFYMYRAQDDKNYEIENDNLGNLAGVM